MAEVLGSGVRVIIANGPHYYRDVLTRLPAVLPSASEEELLALLPHRWCALPDLPALPPAGDFFLRVLPDAYRPSDDVSRRRQPLPNPPPPKT